jgi:hypothetical protein
MTQTEPAHPPQKRATGMNGWREFIQSQMDYAQTDGLALENLIDQQRLSRDRAGAGT